MGMNFRGLDNMRRELDRLQRKVEKVGGTESIPLDELFPSDFMVRHTNFTSFSDMIEQSGFVVDTPDDFANLDEDEWDIFVSRTTLFASWQDMQHAAATERVQRLLDF